VVIFVAVFMVAASAPPPFSAFLRLPPYVQAVQAATAALVAIGLVVGALGRRAGLFVVSVLGAGFCYWYLFAFDRSYLEANLARSLIARGLDAQAVVLGERWTQPQALFWLFRGGGGHPAKIRVLRVRFHAADGADHQVQVVEIYRRPPPTITLAELWRGLRPGTALPIRYLPTDPATARTRTYLEAFHPGVAPTLRSILFAPLALSIVIVLLIIRRSTPRATRAVRP